MKGLVTQARWTQPAISRSTSWWMVGEWERVILEFVDDDTWNIHKYTCSIMFHHVPSCSFIFPETKLFAYRCHVFLKPNQLFSPTPGVPEKKTSLLAGAQGAGHRRSLVEGGPRARKGAQQQRWFFYKKDVDSTTRGETMMLYSYIIVQPGDLLGYYGIYWNHHDVLE